MDKTAIRTANEKWPMKWIWSLYVAEGLPYFAVNVLSVIIYTQMGIGLKEMAFFTGLLYLPWVIKPFWSPFVDIIRTKREWVIWMQLFIAIGMAAIALFLPLPSFFFMTLVVFYLMAFCSATHDIAADGYYMIALTHHQQAGYVGIRNTFYRLASVIGQGGLVWLAGYLQNKTQGNITGSWCFIFGLLAVFFVGIAVYDYFMMPVVREVKSRQTFKSIWTQLGKTFATFFCKRHIGTALCFILLYRLPEALMLKVAVPFMLADRASGGLEMTTQAVGIVNGTVGVICLLGGGILGGICVAIGGLKRWLWPMALALTLPCGLYCYLAIVQPHNLVLISTIIGFEQFGYGFGFTAFMLYLIYFSEGEFKTSHYAFCTGFMALGMMLPGMIAGWIFERLDSLHIFGADGYVTFFWFVMICCLPTYVACALVKIDRSYGLKRHQRKKID